MASQDEAHLLLQMARKDLKAIAGMLDRDVFDDEVFGFHAQQAVEKALKAWIAGMGKTCPCSHDLTRLLSQLEEYGQDVEAYRHTVEFNPFAVLFRYSALNEIDAPLDRPQAIRQANDLLRHVGAFLGREGPAG